MSYDIRLKNPITEETLVLDKPHQMKGGTYRVGGTNFAELNVTYNYSKHFTSIGEKGIRSIYGLSGAQSIPVLKRVIEVLKNDVDKDYWKATEGNAKLALTQLLALAEMRPDGVWDGD